MEDGKLWAQYQIISYLLGRKSKLRVYTYNLNSCILSPTWTYIELYLFHRDSTHFRQLFSTVVPRA